MPEPNDINLALADLKARGPNYRLYEEYFNGKHRLTFATEKFRNAFGSLFQAFADNNCPGVVEPIADRLDLQGFTVESGPKDAAEQAWAVWQANRMDQRAGEVHLEALRAGDAYVIVWPDKDGKPVIYPQRASAVTVHYDEEAVDQINWAAKAWLTEDKHVRLNMYYPDRIEKYITSNASQSATLPDKADAFEPFNVAGEAWPLRNEWGVVPVFHFPNNSDIGHFGRSELKNVIPLQDALNKSLADMLVAMEFVALPQRWATGVEVQFDDDGKPIPPWQTGVDRIIASGSSETKFGEFAQANLAQFIAVGDMLRLSISRVSRTPLHYMMLTTGQWPSGESLKTAEAPFVAKVKDRMVTFGNVWESVMMFCNRIQEAPEAQLSATWNDPSPRSETMFIEGLSRKHIELEVPKRQIWTELGYSDEQQERFEAEAEVTDAERGERVRRFAAAGGVDRSL